MKRAKGSGLRGVLTQLLTLDPDEIEQFISEGNLRALDRLFFSSAGTPQLRKFDEIQALSPSDLMPRPVMNGGRHTEEDVQRQRVHLANEAAVSVFGEVVADFWWNCPCRLLDGKTPRQVMEREAGLLEVIWALSEICSSEEWVRGEGAGVIDSNRDALRVLNAAAALRGRGSHTAVVRWYLDHPIQDLDGKTAEHLVSEGSVDAVLEYIAILGAGATG